MFRNQSPDVRFNVKKILIHIHIHIHSNDIALIFLS